MALSELCLCDNVDLHYTKNPQKHTQIQSKANDMLAPWAQDLRCAFTTSKNKWVKFWPAFEKEALVNPVSSAADFYLYEYIVHASGINSRIPDHIYRDFLDNGFNLSVTYNAGIEAKKQQRQLEDFCVPIFKEYLHYAIVCELCHDAVFARSFFVSNAYEAYWGWGNLCSVVGKETAANHARSLFMRPWKDCFGGKPWAKVAELLAKGEAGTISGAPFDNHLFLDRIFSLEHNTGSVFNKNIWNYKQHYKMDSTANPHYIPYMRTVLDTHHRGDIEKLRYHASPAAKTLYNKAFGDS